MFFFSSATGSWQAVHDLCANADVPLIWAQVRSKQHAASSGILIAKWVILPDSTGYHNYWKVTVSEPAAKPPHSRAQQSQSQMCSGFGAERHGIAHVSVCASVYLAAGGSRVPHCHI